MSKQLYQRTDLKHNKAPKNFGELADCSHHAEGYNPLCGDDVQVFLDLKGGVIKALQFTGKGCAVSQASASIMTEALVGLSLEEAQDRYAEFIKMSAGEENNLEGELSAFAGISQFPSRVKCAVLAWKTFSAALKGTEDKISTE